MGSTADEPGTPSRPAESAGSIRALVHRALLRPFVKLVFGAGVEGRSRLRDLDQFVLVANHNSHLDLPLLFQLLSATQIGRTRPVAAHEYFARSRPLFRTVDWLFRPIWVVRREAAAPPVDESLTGPSPSSAMAEMRQQLRSGGSVVIFPEGTRGEPGRIAPFRTGIGRLAAEFTDVPIVPVFLAGPERALPKSAGVPVPLWTRLIVGSPLRGAEVDGASEDPEDRPARITDAVEGRLRALAENETARRHRRYERRRRSVAVAVLGIDGSGKSTLARSLARRLSAGCNVALVSDEVVHFEDGEPSPVQPLLIERVRQALNRRVKSAKSLKSYKIPKLIELLLRDREWGALRRWNAADILVLDGCPLLNLAAWARLYHEDDYDDDACSAALRIITAESPGRTGPVFDRFPELRPLVRFRLAPLHVPDHVLFLDVEPAVSMERIQARGEARQVHETEHKLSGLRKGYLTVCRVLEPTLGVPAHVLDGRGSPEEVLADALRRLDALNGGAAHRSDAGLHAYDQANAPNPEGGHAG